MLRLARDVDDADPAVRARWQDVVGRLLAARDTGPQPARDDKVVAAWNGLAITAIAEFQQVAALLVSPDDEDANLMDGVLIVSDGAMRDAAEHLADRAPGGRAGCAGSPGTRSSASRPGCWRTTAASPRRSARCTSSPARGGG